METACKDQEKGSTGEEALEKHAEVYNETRVSDQKKPQAPEQAPVKEGENGLKVSLQERGNKPDPAPQTPPVATSDWKVLQDQLRKATLEKDTLTFPPPRKQTASFKPLTGEVTTQHPPKSIEDVQARVGSNGKAPLLDLNDPVHRNNQNDLVADPSQPGGRPASEITLEELAACFHMPSEMACRKLGIGLTVLKRQCRKFGIMRWPFRKIKSLDRLIHNVKLGIVPGDPDKAPVKSVEELEAQKKAMESCQMLDLDESTKKLQQAFSKAHHKAKRMAMQAGIKLDSWGTGTDHQKLLAMAGTSRTSSSMGKEDSKESEDDSQQTGEKAAHFLEGSASEDTEHTSTVPKKNKRKSGAVSSRKGSKAKGSLEDEDQDNLHKRSRKPNPRYVGGAEEAHDPLASLAEIAEACCGKQEDRGKREKETAPTPQPTTPKSTAFCSICHMAFDLKNPRMVFLPCQHARACKSCSLDLWKKPDTMRRCDKCGKQIKVKPFALGGGDITVF
eukprot:scaffold31_cov334-Pavlova_lutheri.AAC.62